MSLTAACAGACTGGSAGNPIKLGVMTSIETNAVSQPWIVQAARIAAAKVNSEGGIMGRPIEIVACDDHGTPQGAAACSQQLFNGDDVLMTVGNDGAQEEALIPALEAHNTISWASAAASISSLGSDNVYTLIPYFWSRSILIDMLPETTRHVAYVSRSDEIHVRGSVEYTPIELAPTSTDFDRACVDIRQTGADTVFADVYPDQAAGLLQACDRAGTGKLLWAMTSSTLTPLLIETLTELDQPNIVALAFGQPALDGFAADVAEFGPTIGGITNTVADTAVNAWLGVTLLADIIPRVGSVDAAKIRAWLDRQKAFDTGGATAPIDFTAAPIVESLPRITNRSATQGEIRNGAVVVTNPTPFTYGPPS
ncbi:MULTISPECIES: ABC transporter substrate-binding protein [unclassified Pseudofrankia]|uniref:ABC transporter substrate-binding protein n=1 Tax=unclassified Pseudofrankia TaxID=2994372 RepID=UPI0009F4E635|nr:MULTISPECIES: ABC transporter substrate-binding protein [unclassified Pseudofrankia]MDT3446875.1 ABC transporter substrate-binding protein [Pseudofrankia sp. BMG5.37]